MKEYDFIILGAGITGISFARLLQMKQDNTRFLILEKESEVGGYCKTTITDNFVWDYSGHFFHFNNKEIKDYVLEHKIMSRKRFTKSLKLKQKGRKKLEDWGLLDDADKENLFDLIAEEFPDL